MTRPATPNADALIALLPHDYAARVRPTTRLDYNIARAVSERGWTFEQLAAEATRNPGDPATIGGLVTERMAVAATVPPPKTAIATGKSRPFCSPECRDNQGWVLDAAFMPVERCKCRGAA